MNNTTNFPEPTAPMVEIIDAFMEQLMEKGLDYDIALEAAERQAARYAR